MEILFPTGRKSNFPAQGRVQNLEKNLKLCQKDGVVPVSALATDVLTENVFIITEDHSHLQVKAKLIILLYSPEETWPYVY